jgi:hypothetical protein
MLFKNSVRTSKRTPHFTITKINCLTLFKFNPLKPKLVQMLFKNSVRTSKRTPHFTITKIYWLTLFKFNPLKPKLVQMLFKNPVRTSKRTPHFTITKINWLTLFKEIIVMRFQVLTAASIKFRIVFWDVLPCKIIVDRRFRGTYCLHHQGRQLFYTAVHPRRQFSNNRCLHRQSYRTHKYKIQSYWFLNQLEHIVTIGFKGLGCSQSMVIALRPYIQPCYLIPSCWVFVKLMMSQYVSRLFELLSFAEKLIGLTNWNLKVTRSRAESRVVLKKSVTLVCESARFDKL